MYAVYYDALKRKIEDEGTENFPQVGGKKLYGELTMIVTVDAKRPCGRHRSRRILGQPHAGPPGCCHHARAAGPFGNFTPAMRRQVEQISVVSRFKFTRDETLQTAISNHP